MVPKEPLAAIKKDLHAVLYKHGASIEFREHAEPGVFGDDRIVIIVNREEIFGASCRRLDEYHPRPEVLYKQNGFVKN